MQGGGAGWGAGGRNKEEHGEEKGGREVHCYNTQGGERMVKVRGRYSRIIPNFLSVNSGTIQLSLTMKSGT